MRWKKRPLGEYEARPRWPAKPATGGAAAWPLRPPGPWCALGDAADAAGAESLTRRRRALPPARPHGGRAPAAKEAGSGMVPTEAQLVQGSPNGTEAAARCSRKDQGEHGAGGCACAAGPDVSSASTRPGRGGRGGD